MASFPFIAFITRMFLPLLILTSFCVMGSKGLRFNVATPLWASVRMKLTLPKVGTWSPSGLPKTQSLIAGVKTPHMGVFFIPLERS
jgi:hypothetical protein